MHIEISSTIKEKCPEVSLGILTANVCVVEPLDEIKSILNVEVKRIQNNFTMDNYKNSVLESARVVYRKLKKDPSRYRISSDSLFRRIIKGKGVYYVNNVVDINNVISLRTLWSVGAYDIDKIVGDISYRVGTSDDIYEGIGRGILNIENLPVLVDEESAFGSATSDSLRTMVTTDTKRLMMVVHAFDGEEGLFSTLNEMKEFLVKYADAENIEIKMI